MSTARFDKLLAERPEFHRGETETRRNISTAETILQGAAFENTTRDAAACYGISEETAKFIDASISEGKKGARCVY